LAFLLPVLGGNAPLSSTSAFFRHYR